MTTMLSALRVSADLDTGGYGGSDAWNKLTDMPDVIRSIGMRQWAHVDRCK